MAMISQLWNCNRLWKIWYAILITLLQGYVIINGIRQYVNFKSQYYNPRYGERWDFGPLHFYVGCIIFAIALMGFFLYFSLVNVHRGQYSNVRYLLDKEGHQNSFIDVVKIVLKLCQEQLPYSHVLHYVISVCLMLPLPVMQMEEIRNEALSPDSIWTADLDFFSEHFEWSKIDTLSNAVALRNMHYVKKSTNISIEFLNFVIASILILLKMPTVFWSAHKCFSIIYSMLLFFNCVTWLMIYEAGSILIKFSGNRDLLELSKNVRTPTQYPVLLTLIILQFVFTLFGFIAIFAYGNTQTVLCWLFRFKCLGLNDFISKRRNCWIILVVASGFLLLVFNFIVNSFLNTAFFQHFQLLRSTIFMSTIIIGIVNLTVNFLAWFTFAIKTKWDFNLEFNKPSNQNENTMDQGYKLTSPADAIYGCFHNNITLSSSSSHSSGPGTMRTLEGASSECSGHGPNFQNYIYMQNNAQQIPTISEDYDENQTNTMKSMQQLSDKAINSMFEDSMCRGREMVSISDNGIDQSNENINSDSYRTRQMYDGRKLGKLVKFEGMDEENAQALKFYEKRYSSNNFNEKDLNFLKVPDILNLNSTDLSCSHSESSLDLISSSTSSKIAVDQSDQGLCSQV